MPLRKVFTDFPEAKLTPRRLPEEDLHDVEHDEDLEQRAHVLVTPPQNPPVRSGTASVCSPFGHLLTEVCAHVDPCMGIYPYIDVYGYGCIYIYTHT